MKTVKFCKDCKWSIPDKDGWNMGCRNPAVVAEDYWTLASPKEVSYTDARSERKKTWFAKCGLKGKLWEVNGAE